MSPAIIGYGETDLGEVPDHTPFELKMWAAAKAMEDAKVSPSEIDGLISAPPMEEDGDVVIPVIAEYLGVMPIRWASDPNLGGAAFVQAVVEAEMIIERGYADIVLIVAADSLRTSVGVDEVVSELSGLASQFEDPANIIPSLYAHAARWHMDEFGTTPEELAAIAAIDYEHAAMQRPERAQMNESMTVDEILDAPMIAEPLTAPQCSLISDGGAALVVVSDEIAAERDVEPVELTGFGANHTHEHISAMPDFGRTGAGAAGEAAMAEAGVEHDDLDVIQIYDCFTITVIRMLEDLGFCEHGEGGALATSGDLELGGKWPMNTHGGALAQAHPGPVGMFHITEAVRQLRGEAEATQVDGAETALVHGNGGILSTQGVAILERGD